MTHPHIPYREYNITWQSINVSIRYTPQWSKFSEMAHLEIRRDDDGKLPVTETGYRSLFTYNILIEDRGGPIEYVDAWLEEYAQKKDWKSYLANERQLTLF